MGARPALLGRAPLLLMSQQEEELLHQPFQLQPVIQPVAHVSVHGFYDGLAIGIPPGPF